MALPLLGGGFGNLIAGAYFLGGLSWLFIDPVTPLSYLEPAS